MARGAGGTDPGRAARRLEVGRVAKPHGLRGEVVVAPVTNRRERFVAGADLWADGRAVVVATARPHHDRWLVRFEGVDDRDGAEALRGATLTAEAIDDPDVLWVHEMVGFEVVDEEGRPLGRITAVEANPAHDLLVLDGGGLVPVVFVRAVQEGRVVVDVPEGLLDPSP